MKIFNVFYLSNFEIILKKDILQYLFIKSIVNTFVDIAFKIVHFIHFYLMQHFLLDYQNLSYFQN